MVVFYKIADDLLDRKVFIKSQGRRGMGRLEFYERLCLSMHKRESKITVGAVLRLRDRIAEDHANLYREGIITLFEYSLLTRLNHKLTLASIDHIIDKTYGGDKK